MIRNKLKNIKSKISRGKKKVYITISVMLVFLFTFIVYNINSYDFSKLHASVSEITNNTFKDEDFYTCVIDAYNKDNNASKTIQDNLTDTELSNITNLNCSRTVYDVSGIEKLSGLVSLKLGNHSEIEKIDLSNNLLLESLDLDDCSGLTDINLSKNEKLKTLSLEYIHDMSSLDLSNNALLTNLGLTYNSKLSKLILNENVKLESINLEGTALFDSVGLQVGQVYKLKSNIIGPKLTYDCSSTSLIKLEDNTVTALNEGREDIRVFLNDKDIGNQQRIYIGKKVELSTYNPGHITINNSEKYVYVKDGTEECIKSDYCLNLDQHSSSDIHSSIGHPEVNVAGDTLKIMSYDDVIDEYKLVYIDTGTNDNNAIIKSSVDEPDKFSIKGINCDYEFSDDKKELIVKYNGDEIDRRPVVMMFMPSIYKNNKAYDVEIFLFSKEAPKVKKIYSIDEIDKNMINVLNNNVEVNDTDNKIKITDDSNSELFNLYYTNVFSDNYDLSKDYIYLGTSDFNNDILMNGSSDYLELEVLDDSVVSYDEGEKVLEWKLIKIASDKYNMNSDTIDLNNEDIDLSSITLTNANIEIKDDKLLIMYNGNIIRTINIVGKKTTTTTTAKTSTKKEDKVVTSSGKNNINETTTTSKKVDDKTTSTTNTTLNIKENTTVTTTKKVSIRKNYDETTNIDENSSSTKKENKNSIIKMVSDNKFIILIFVLILIIGTTIYLYVNKKDNKKL